MTVISRSADYKLVSLWNVLDWQTAKQNYRGSVASHDTRPGNEVSLFYNAAEPHAEETGFNFLIRSQFVK